MTCVGSSVIKPGLGGQITIEGQNIHIHIHTPDTGIPPHVVIRNLEVHMGLAERLSRALPREWARYFG